MRGAIDIRIGDDLIPFRLGLADLEELEEALDMSVFVLIGALSAELPFAKQRQCREVIRCGLIGGGMERTKADKQARAWLEEHGPGFGPVVALDVLRAGLKRVRGDEEDASGEAKAARSSA